MIHFDIRRMVVLILVLVLAGCNLLPVSTQSAQVREKGEATTAPGETIPAESEPEPSHSPTEEPQPVSSPQPARITAQNAAGLSMAHQTALEDNPFQIKWSADSAILGVQKQDGLSLLNSADLSVVSSVVIDEPVFLLDYSAEGRRMATTVDQMTLEVRDIATGEVRRTIPRESPFLDAVFSPDGKTLAITSSLEIGVDIWDIEQGSLRQTLKGFETAAPVYSVKFSMDGQHLIWWARASVQVMPIATGQPGPMLSHEDFVGGLALSPDGQTLAAATAGTLDGEFMPYIRLWNASSGQAIGELKTGQQIPYSISFSADGNLLAASTDAYILIWNVPGRQQVAALTNPDGLVNAVAFSPDGRTLASSSEGGQLALWQVFE